MYHQALSFSHFLNFTSSSHIFVSLIFFRISCLIVNTSLLKVGNALFSILLAIVGLFNIELLSSFVANLNQSQSFIITVQSALTFVFLSILISHNSHFVHCFISFNDSSEFLINVVF